MKRFAFVLVIALAFILGGSLVRGNAQATDTTMGAEDSSQYQGTPTSSPLPPPFTPTLVGTAGVTATPTPVLPSGTPLPTILPSVSPTFPPATFTPTFVPSVSPTHPPFTPSVVPSIVPSSTPQFCRAQFFFEEPGAEYVFNNGPLNGLPFELCPSSRPQTTVAQFTHFTNGFVIYRFDTRTLYVFIDDGTGTVIILNGLQTDASVGRFDAASAVENVLDGIQMRALGAATNFPTWYLMTFQSSNDPIVSWHGGTVMTLPSGGRLFVTNGAFTDPPPVWAYVNRIN